MKLQLPLCTKILQVFIHPGKVSKGYGFFLFFSCKTKPFLSSIWQDGCRK